MNEEFLIALEAQEARAWAALEKGRERNASEAEMNDLRLKWAGWSCAASKERLRLETIEPQAAQTDPSDENGGADLSQTFVCEVGTVNTETKTTGWREVARYANEETAIGFVSLNASRCACRYRKDAIVTAKTISA